MMEKITIKGSEFLLPEELCVSCGRLSDPKSFIVVTFRAKGYHKEFRFPACQHCAALYKRYWRRAVWMNLVIMLPLVTAGGLFFFTGYYRQIVNTYGSTGNLAVSAGLIAVLVVMFLITSALTDSIVLGSLGEQNPPLQMVRISSIAPGFQWTFQFQNEIYAQRFRELNQVVLKTAYQRG